MSAVQEFPNLHIVDHPLVQHKLSHLRDQTTSSHEFRALLREMALLIGYEITRVLDMSSKKITTPITEMEAPILASIKPAIVPVLRAGLGMAEGLSQLIPTAPTGHIGLFRDPKTKRPIEYYVRLPENKDRLFILVDPMLATGYSASYAVDVLNKYGVPDSKVRFMAMVAAPEGMCAFNEAHPTVEVWAAALDEKLNEKAYIVPGLGDAGDRLFETN